MFTYLSTIVVSSPLWWVSGRCPSWERGPPRPQGSSTRTTVPVWKTRLTVKSRKSGRGTGSMNDRKGTPSTLIPSAVPGDPTTSKV